MTDGEAWARDALRALRAARFSPTASRAFVGASRTRAAEHRRARPSLARQARRWELIGLLTWLGLAAAGTEPYRRRLAPGMASWAATSLMLDWHLGMVETESGDPRDLGPADALTLARAWLVPVVGDRVAPLAIAVAAATDGLDGLAARATAPTRAGRDLELLVDAAVLIAALRRCASDDLLARPVVVFESTRLLGGFGIGCASYFGAAKRPDPELLRAARSAIPIRVMGLMAAGAGRRSVAGRLVILSGLASAVLHARAALGLRRRHHSAGIPAGKVG